MRCDLRVNSVTLSGDRAALRRFSDGPRQVLKHPPDFSLAAVRSSALTRFLGSLAAPSVGYARGPLRALLRMWNTMCHERASRGAVWTIEGRQRGVDVRSGGAGAAAGRRMRAVEIIAKGGILLNPPCGTFEQAVASLVDTLIANKRLPDAMRHGAVRAVVDRETMASTAIVEIGVSVPHARLTGVAGVIAALAATPTALYYATAGVPISIMVLVFSAPDQIGEHLDTLASISLLLQSPTLRRNVEHAADPDAALRVLRGQNGLGL